MSIKDDVLAEYLGRGNPTLADYYPAWLDNLADDATVEGSLLDGAVQGAEAVRSIVVAIRSLYDRQEHKFAGPCGEYGFLEDYVAEVRGEPIGCVVLAPATTPGRPSTSWRATGHAARCCSCPACCARGSPAPPMPSTSPPASPEADLPMAASNRLQRTIRCAARRYRAHSTKGREVAWPITDRSS